MFTMPPIPKNKMPIWQRFEEEIYAFSRNGIPGTLFKKCLEKMFAHSQNCPDLLICVVNHLFLYIVHHPHVYVFCQRELKDYHLQAMVSYLGLVPQPGITLFNLLVGIALCNDASEQDKGNEAAFVCDLRKAVETSNSFPALLLLHEIYNRHLRRAIEQSQNPNDIQPILAKELVEDMSQDILRQGEIHGTPVYVLRANFCFWNSQYYNIVLKDTVLAKICSQLAMRYLVCAENIREYSQAAITNAVYVYNMEPTAKEERLQYNFFKLLGLVTRGETQVLLDYIKSISGLGSPEIDRTIHLGLIDTKSFISKFSTYVLAKTEGDPTSAEPAVAISCTTFT